MKERDILKKIVDEQGIKIYRKSESQRFVGLLSDYAFDANKIKLLNLAINDGIPDKLLSKNSADDYTTTHSSNQ